MRILFMLMIRNFVSYDWFTLSLIVLCIGLVLLKNTNAVKYKQFVKLGFSDAYWLSKDKENRLLKIFDFIIIMLAHLIIAQGLYLWINAENFEIPYTAHPFLEFSVIFIGVLIFSLLKYFFEKAINKSFNDSSFLDYYIFYKQIIWTYAVFLALPFLILMVYLPFKDFNFFNLILIIAGVFYTLKLLIFAFKNRSVLVRNWYYFILYLCALEIAPYLFLYKIFAVQ